MGLPASRVFVDEDMTNCGDVFKRFAFIPPNVIIGGSPASKFGDPNTPHLPPGICIGAEQGAVRPVNKVFVLGQPLAHIAAVVDCGTTVAFGCPTVLVG